jgi:hypothetical protein
MGTSVFPIHKIRRRQSLALSASGFVSEGSVVSPQQPLCLVAVAGTPNHMLICFPAYIEKFCVAAGMSVSADGFILRWVADGESIPYGRTHFELRPVAA